MENENKSKLNEKILKILNDGLANGLEDENLDFYSKYVILVVILSSFCFCCLFYCWLKIKIKIMKKNK